MEGVIKVTTEGGAVLFEMNIWTMFYMMAIVAPAEVSFKIDVPLILTIDGTVIEKPDSFFQEEIT